MLSEASLIVNLVVFGAAAAAITWTGIRLAALADKLADRTGLGEAFVGTIFLGATTSLPGLAATVFAALEGRPILAISNVIGGIAAQTTFLALADLAHKKVNLEHAAASATNLLQVVLLLMLLALLLGGMTGPDITVAHVHPVTLIAFSAAVGGFWLVYRFRSNPMWTPKHTMDTVEDKPDEESRNISLPILVGKFLAAATVITISGVVVAHTTGNIADRTGISEAVAGSLMSGLVTSLPELVTAIAAVRRKALTLAVSDIVGGNFIDVLFVAIADLAYLEGSIYHAEGIDDATQFLIVLVILMNLVLLLGLIYRQRKGPGNIGFESISLLVLYPAGIAVLMLTS